LGILDKLFSFHILRSLQHGRNLLVLLPLLCALISCHLLFLLGGQLHHLISLDLHVTLLVEPGNLSLGIGDFDERSEVSLSNDVVMFLQTQFLLVKPFLQLLVTFISRGLQCHHFCRNLRLQVKSLDNIMSKLLFALLFGLLLLDV